MSYVYRAKFDLKPGFESVEQVNEFCRECMDEVRESFLEDNHEIHILECADENIEQILWEFSENSGSVTFFIQDALTEKELANLTDWVAFDTSDGMISVVMNNYPDLFVDRWSLPVHFAEVTDEAMPDLSDALNELRFETREIIHEL